MDVQPPVMPMPSQSGIILTVGPSGQYSTFEAAVLVAAAGDTIHIANGTYSGTHVIIDKDLTIIGIGSVTINYGPGTGPYIELLGDYTNVVLQNLILIGNDVNTALLGDNQYRGPLAGTNQITHLINVRAMYNTGGGCIFAFKTEGSYDIQGGSLCSLYFSGYQFSITQYNGVGTTFHRANSQQIASLSFSPSSYTTISGLTYDSNSFQTCLYFYGVSHPYIALSNNNPMLVQYFYISPGPSMDIVSSLPILDFTTPIYFSITVPDVFVLLTGPTSTNPTFIPSLSPTIVTNTTTSTNPTFIPSLSPTIVTNTTSSSYGKKRYRQGGLCENHCSNHGICVKNLNCKCFDSPDGTPEWTGPDCSLRTCPKDVAWVSSVAKNRDDLHPLAECSNKGTCDQKSGTCTCFAGYDGIACERTICPNDCNGRGKCLPLSVIASDAGHSYEVSWDAKKQMGCVCDSGYRGPSCEFQECPSGADPLNGFGSEAGRDCSGRGKCDYISGTCSCFSGFHGSRCQYQTILD